MEVVLLLHNLHDVLQLHGLLLVQIRDELPVGFPVLGAGPAAARRGHRHLAHPCGAALLYERAGTALWWRLAVAVVVVVSAGSPEAEGKIASEGPEENWVVVEVHIGRGDTKAPAPWFGAGSSMDPERAPAGMPSLHLVSNARDGVRPTHRL